MLAGSGADDPAMRFLLIVFISAAAFAQEFVPEKVVFPITDFKPDLQYLSPVSLKFATGFCLDPDCRFVGTNYHVAKLMGKYVRIQGAFSANRYLDSSPDDAGAEDVKMLSLFAGSLKYTPAHDLAIYEMRHPLKGRHGIGFAAEDAEELQASPDVEIYAYPLHWNPKRGLAHWQGKFIAITAQGLLAFRCGQGGLAAGASGGIVVDSRTKKIVGILSEKGDDNDGPDQVALAVPVTELSAFVTRAQPYLQAALFPKTVFVSPVAADLYPPYVWPRSNDFLPRPTNTPQVFKLRLAAQHLADSLHDFTATQTFAWGHDNRQPDAVDAFETLIADGWQQWRRPGTKKLYSRIPFPPLDDWMLPGSEWSWLPQMVGTELDLKIHQAPDAVVGGRTVRVFQYAAGAEDGVCPFAYLRNFVLFQSAKPEFYDCHGEVWTDEAGIILRISEALDLTGPAHHYWAVVTYGWLEKGGTQYLVPVTIASQLERKKTYWCRGLFTDYEMFDVKTRLLVLDGQGRLSEFGP